MFQTPADPHLSISRELVPLFLQTYLKFHHNSTNPPPCYPMNTCATALQVEVERMCNLFLICPFFHLISQTTKFVTHDTKKTAWIFGDNVLPSTGATMLLNDSDDSVDSICSQLFTRGFIMQSHLTQNLWASWRSQSNPRRISNLGCLWLGMREKLACPTGTTGTWGEAGSPTRLLSNPQQMPLCNPRRAPHRMMFCLCGEQILLQLVCGACMSDSTDRFH